LNLSPEESLPTNESKKIMKPDITKYATIVQTPVYPPTRHQFRPVPPAAVHAPLPKRDNIFSKSRDTREDRGTREMKTTQNARAFPRTRQFHP
jgi:hypothetical protein